MDSEDSIDQTHRTRSAQRSRRSPSYYLKNLNGSVVSAYSASAASPLLNSVSRNELSEHVRQDAAVPECDQFLRGVDSHERLKFDPLIANRSHGDMAHRLQTILDADDLEQLATGKLQRGGIGAVLELQWKNPHVDQIAAVNALEALCDH